MEIAAVLLVVFLAVCAVYWRLAVVSALWLVLLEGALRKWVLPGFSDLIYFAKDFVLIGAYIGYFLKPPSKRVSVNLPYALGVLLLLTFIWGCVMVFAPGVGSPIVGIFGLRNYFIYVPLLWLVPGLLKETSSFQRFLRVYILATIPVAILSIIQFFSPPDSILNVYVPSEEISGVATFGEANQFARVTGTFSYLASYANYLLFCLVLLLPLSTTSLLIKNPRFSSCCTLMSLALVTIASFMTGSRGLVIPFVFMGIFYFLINQLSIEKYPLPKLVSKRLAPFFLALALSLPLIFPAVDAFWFRLQNAGGPQGDLNWRIAQIVTQPLEFSSFNGLDGFGIGTTHQATSVLMRRLNLSSGQPINVYFENETGRIMLELGPIGFVLWYLLRLIIISELYRLFRRLRQPLYRKLSLTALLFHIFQIHALLVFSPVASFFYWFTTSFITILPRLESLEQLDSIAYYYAHSEPS